ncbi:MAG TPA: ABC transporter permease [Bryobacteraceae bacterium]|nr:ABC transporter permease [Bryobacteraceae bacterium]
MSNKKNIRRSASFLEAGRIAIDSLNKNKLRSFLTLLGIILATTTLISVTSLIHGMNLYIANKVSDMGSDGFRIVRMSWFGQRDPKKMLLMQKRNPQIRPEEYAFIKQHSTLLRGIGLEDSDLGRVSFQGQSTDASVEIQGVTSEVPALNNVQAEAGREITEGETQRHAAVAFLGSDVRKKFFENRDPIGKTIQINGSPFEVVGVAKPLGSVFGQSQDDFVMIPIENYFKLFNSRKGIDMVAKAIDQGRLVEAKDETTMLLRTYRHLRPGQDDTFGIMSSDSFVELWQRLTAAIAATAVGIVSVFMVVGGIVIMNIMLAAVTERTHEIGIRKSLGARRADILNQFLVESATLAASGGLIGVVIAWLISVVIRNAASVPMALPLSSVIIGVGLSAMVGLFFGIYPAKQASKLDPIVALRTEN